MQFKLYSCLRSTLLLSTGLSLGLVTLIPVAGARIASNGTSFNGTFPNGIAFNSMNLKSDSSSTLQLQLEGSQLVLHLDR